MLSDKGPNILVRTSSGSAESSIVVDCFRAEPLARFEDARSDEAEESLDTKDNEEPLGEMPGLCDVIYGLMPLDVRRGSGDERAFDGGGVLPG